MPACATVVSRLVSRFTLPSILVPALLAAPMAVARAGEPPDAANLVALLARGVDELVVADLAGCPDVESLRLYIGIGESGEYAELQAPFAGDTPGVQPALATGLAAERRGLVASPMFGFGMASPLRDSRRLGASGFSLQTTGGGPSFGRSGGFGDGWSDPFADPFLWLQESSVARRVAGGSGRGSAFAPIAAPAPFGKR